MTTVGSPRPCFFRRSGGAVYAAERRNPPTANATIGQPALHGEEDHDREAHRVDDERVDRESLAAHDARDHRVRRVEVAGVVGGIGADLEVEEVVHDVVRHVREHDAETGEGEVRPVDARIAEHREQSGEAGGHEGHREHARPGQPQPLRHGVERALRRVGGGEHVEPLLGQALLLVDDGVGHGRSVSPLTRAQPPGTGS